MSGTTGNAGLSIFHGPPLSEEPSLGALTLPGYLKEITARYAEREALVMHHGASVERWTYADLWDRSMEVARALVALGVGKDSRVGVLMTNRPEWLSATFGASLTGATVVQLNTFSTVPELEYLLSASSVSIVMYEGNVLKKDFTEMLGEVEPAILTDKPGEIRSLKFPFLRRFAVVGQSGRGTIESWQDFLAHGRDIAPEFVEAIAATTKSTDTAAIFFSSGSTARPKGIVSAHRGIVIQLWRWGRIFCLDGPIVRAWTPNGFFWSGNFGTVLGTTLSVGGCLVLQSTFIPSEALELMDVERVNFPMIWPHQAKQLEEAPNWNEVDLRAMCFVDNQDVLGQHPSRAPGAWHNPTESYGSTETFTITTGRPGHGPIEDVLGSHGKTLVGCAVKVVDPISGEIVPIGEHGEIAVKGPTLMLGYLGVPIEDALDDQGFFHTGDAGHFDKRECLHFEGRLSTVVKTGGANVSPLEIEAVLESFPGVKIARVVGVPHEALGEMVVACIVPAPDATVDGDALIGFTKTQLASYKVPRRLLFLREDELELTGSAKVKPAELRKLALAKLAQENEMAV